MRRAVYKCRVNNRYPEECLGAAPASDHLISMRNAINFLNKRYYQRSRGYSLLLSATHSTYDH